MNLLPSTSNLPVPAGGRRGFAGCRADFPVCPGTGLSSPVVLGLPRAAAGSLETGDTKVAVTGGQECPPYAEDAVGQTFQSASERDFRVPCSGPRPAPHLPFETGDTKVAVTGGQECPPYAGGARARRPGRQGGFSLLELLGVMLVALLLALAVTPSLINQLDRLAKQQESATLTTLCDGLRDYVLTARRMPAAATVHADIAAQIGWETRTVQTNNRGNPRIFMVDPALRIGTNTPGTLPYVQGRYGAPTVAAVRVLFVSTMGADLPNVIAGPSTNATTVFNLLWNAADNGTMPVGWIWGGDWPNLQLQRLNLTPLFTQVVLNNNTPRIGRFSIDDTNSHVVLPSHPFSAFYLARTALGLHSDAGALQAMQVVQEPISLTNRAGYSLFPSYVYENGLWRGRLFMDIPPPRHAGHDLQAAYEIFMSGPPNLYKSGGANQTSVSWSMYLYMSNYVNWANANFPASGASKTSVRNAQSTLAAQVGVYCNKKATAN